MARDYSNYSVPQLEQALASIDGEKHPDNKAALEQELERRKEAGEVERLLCEAREEWLRRERRSIRIARRVRQGVAAYLVLAPLYAFAGIEVSADSEIVQRFALGIFIAFLVASAAGGVGLFLDKAWGHWLAVVLLALQLFKIQAAGFAFSLLSLGGVYLYVAAGGVGVSAEFDPGFTFALRSELPLWVGINVLFIPLIVYLFTAREEMP